MVSTRSRHQDVLRGLSPPKRTRKAQRVFAPKPALDASGIMHPGKLNPSHVKRNPSYVDASTQTTESSLTENTVAEPQTLGKRVRDERHHDETEDRPAKRTLFTPISNRSFHDRAPRSAPAGRRRPLRTPLGVSRISRTPSKFSDVSIQSRLARENANPQSLDSAENHNNTTPRDTQQDISEVQPKGRGLATTTTQELGPEDANKDTASTTPQPQTPARSIFGHIFGSAKKILTPLIPFKTPSAEVSQETQASQSRSNSHSVQSPLEDNETSQDNSADETRPPVTPSPPTGQINIFSGRQSSYGTPTTQIMKKTAEQIQQQMLAEAEAVYDAVEASGQGDPAWLAERRRQREESGKTTTGEKRKAPHYNDSSLDLGAYFDQDNRFEGIDESSVESSFQPGTPPAKSQKTQFGQTPNKSAMKKAAPAALGAPTPRSTKSVIFNDNPVASTRQITRYQGPAGHYTGTTFADHSPSFSSDLDSSSSLDYSEIISPSTRINTQMNATSKDFNTTKYDPSYRDPTNPDWRPSPANPRPSTFCVPDWDDFESMVEEEGSTVTAPPASPRPAHAALPSGSPANSSSMSLDTSSYLGGANTSKLNKAREQAEKYKPKDSSRLSQVEAARSRSSSPPLSPAKANAASQLVADADLENQTPDLTSDEDEERDENGMTEYDREHQYDEWARNLPWPKPVLRTESGVSSEFMENYITEHWGDEDDEQSEKFYKEEFERVDEAFRQAEEMGVEVEFVRD